MQERNNYIERNHTLNAECVYKAARALHRNVVHATITASLSGTARNTYPVTWQYMAIYAEYDET